jgi:hypothetical protein
VPEIAVVKGITKASGVITTTLTEDENHLRGEINIAINWPGQGVSNGRRFSKIKALSGKSGQKLAKLCTAAI